MNRKLRSVLDLLNPSLTDKVESSQSAQKVSHDKRAKPRIFACGDTVYVRNYGQGPAWIKGTIVDTAGPHNFTVQVNLAGQFTSWRRHIDELKRCYEDITVQNNSQKLMDSTVSSEAEEEEKNNESGVTEVWTNPNSASHPVCKHRGDCIR